MRQASREWEPGGTSRFLGGSGWLPGSWDPGRRGLKTPGRRFPQAAVNPRTITPP
jgi:hypothetical protein